MKNNVMNYQMALDFFNLKEGFTREDLNKVYKPLIAKWHTDINKSDEAIEMSKKINEAFDILKRYLLNKENAKKDQDYEKQYDIERANFLNDINNLKTKYKDYKEVIRICDKFLNDIKVIYENKGINVSNKLNELRNQKKEFNQKIESIKAKINFQISKDNFLKRLIDDRNIKQLDEVIKLSVLFQERLNDIYKLEDLKLLEKEYYEEKERLIKEEKRRELDNNINDSINRINALKEKYKDTKTNNLIEMYSEKFKICKYLEELIKMQNKFQEEFDSIRLEFKNLSNLKDKILNTLVKYESMYLDSKELLVSYMNKVNEIDNLEELNELEKEINDNLIKLDNKEKDRQDKVNKIKDQLKRITIYKFYKSATNVLINDILEYKDLLKKVFEVIDKMTYDTLNEVEVLVENINYNNLEKDKSNIELYLLTIKDNVKNKDNIKDYIMSLQEDVDNDYESLEMNQVRRDVVNMVLGSYYRSSTKASIKENQNILDSLTNVLTMLEEMSDKELSENTDLISKINFSNLEEVKKVLKQLGLGNKIFISFKTGKTYTKDLLGDDIILTPIDRDTGIELSTKKHFEFDYISLSDFFKKATCVSQRKVYEKMDEYNSRSAFQYPEQEFLYFYKELMLKCDLSNIDNSHQFKFTTSKTKYGWEVSDFVPFRDNRYLVYEDREKCEELVLKELKEQIELNKKLERDEETIDF